MISALSIASTTINNDKRNSASVYSGMRGVEEEESIASERE